ncbi:MAG: cyclomaltodextrinase C-terminal domain-containing protein, partial [Bacteroidales bacterium]|nr:cyclomaltodextrinase C-terminal domain-containing protein [Bacteroidales bacterium]
GGDIAGITGHLDYLRDLGITTLWINPLMENDNPEYSYHGYAITDFYRIDPRFGSNDDYGRLVVEAHARGLKVIMDMVFNHCSIHHPLMQDLPDSSWIHHFDHFTRSNFRGSTLADPHASEYDRTRFLTGWFDTHMADLDQRNPLLTKYLIQNTIWWIESAGIDGIRIDTQPYSYEEFIRKWSERIFLEYPGLGVVGESWLQKESFTAYFQGDRNREDGHDSGIPSVTDFPVHYALRNALTEPEGWTTGLARIYYVLAQDFLYPDPYLNLVFADNHDLTRYFSSVGEDLAFFKMAMAFLLTARGIPMIYYGTEILMTGEEHLGHGFIRKDFPGGWPGDTVNAFVTSGRTDQQNEAFEFLSRLLHWRKSSRAAVSGRLIHFVPENGVYVFFRIAEHERIMTVLNKNNQPVVLRTERFFECLKDFSGARDVITGTVSPLTGIEVPGKSSAVFDLIP